MNYIKKRQKQANRTKRKKQLDTRERIKIILDEWPDDRYTITYKDKK